MERGAVVVTIATVDWDQKGQEERCGRGK